MSSTTSLRRGWFLRLQWTSCRSCWLRARSSRTPGCGWTAWRAGLNWSDAAATYCTTVARADNGWRWQSSGALGGQDFGATVQQALGSSTVAQKRELLASIWKSSGGASAQSLNEEELQVRAHAMSVPNLAR